MGIYNCEVHTVQPTRGQFWSFQMKVDGIDNFIRKYTAHSDVMTEAVQESFKGIGGCPREEQWNANCNNTHPIANVKLELKRGALMEPPSSGAKAGIARDPQYDNNYFFDIVSFILNNTFIIYVYYTK